MALPQHIVLEVLVEGYGCIGHFYPATERLEIEPATRLPSPQMLVDIVRCLMQHNRAGELMQEPVVHIDRDTLAFIAQAPAMVRPSSIPGALEPVDHGMELIKPKIPTYTGPGVDMSRLTRPVPLDAADERREAAWGAEDFMKRLYSVQEQVECKHYDITPDMRSRILGYFKIPDLTCMTAQKWEAWEAHLLNCDRVDTILAKLSGEWVATADGDVESPSGIVFPGDTMKEHVTVVEERKPYHEQVFDKPWYQEEGE